MLACFQMLACPIWRPAMQAKLMRHSCRYPQLMKIKYTRPEMLRRVQDCLELSDGGTITRHNMR